MANSSTNMVQISPSQSGKEPTLNGIVDALSPAALYGRHAPSSAALTWGYYGGTVSIAGTPTQVANGTVTLAASATNYVEANPATGSVSVNQAGFTAGRTPLYTVVTGASTVSNYTDLRVLGGGGGGVSAGDVSDAIAAHEAESDPHPQYQTQTEGDARYDALGAATAAVSAHAAASDPHPQYLTQAEADSLYAHAGGGSETTTTMGALIAGATAKTTPVDADYLGLMDSAASNVLKKLSWANLKAALKTYFDTLYATVSQPFDLVAFYPGVPSASAIVTRIPVARAVTFPSGLTGSVAKASVAATSSTAFDIQKNGSSVGTITFAAAGTSATFTAASAITLAAGDVLAIIAPSTADATLANVGFVLAGTR